MIDVKIDFDDAAFGLLSRRLTPAALLAATRRAVRKTALWVRTHLLRRLRDHDIRRKVIIHRIRLYNKNWRNGEGGGPAVKVWFGIDAINADTLAKPRKDAGGYWVKDFYFPGAFVPTINPKFKGKLYSRTTRERLPFQREKIEIEAAANDAFNQIVDQIPGRLQELMRQELNYEVEKMLGRAR
ncbi:hypothetical protein [Microvirgula aerodenitrificans]|uniref:hypothetical protein n=1 Tax=Microvirgula aerodenitrificans TaxID=57480 RepID=UPI0028EE4D85|nr:hypothetical protein [Microvirgula aerodenitrificans]